MSGHPVLVFSALLLHEGHMAQQLLEAAGIDAELRGGNRAGLGGLIPFEDAQLEVWVSSDRLRDAQRALGLQVNPVADGRLSFVDGSAPEGGLSHAVVGPGALSEAGGEPAPPTVVEQCPACGQDWEEGFEVCWSCQHVLP
jgi:hypothetical protein